MKSIGTEFKVGLFTLAAAVMIGYMFFVLNPNFFQEKEYKTYFTIAKNASGVIPKTHVKTNGVTVGKVKKVELETNSTRITMEIEAHVKIPKDSTIEFRSKGFLGDMFVEVIRGDDTGEYISNRGEIPMSAAGSGLDALIAIGTDIAQDVKKVTKTLANVLGTKEGEQDIAKFVKNLSSISTQVDEILAENRGDVRSAISNLQKTAATFGAAFGGNEQEKKVVAMVDDLRTFTSGLKELMSDSNRQRYDRIIGNLDQSLEDVKGATKNVKLIAEKIERGEGTIGKLVNDDKTLTEIEGAVKDIRKVIGPAARLQIEVDAHLEGKADKTNQTYFNVALRTRPDKFYLVGFTDREREVITTETETVSDNPATADNGPTRTTKESIKKEGALRYNVQFGKRWYFAALRFGLFESSGGAATDLYLFRDRFRFSFEAFNFKSTDNPARRTAHFKSYASILFFNHVYALAGVDDITRLNKNTGKIDTPNYIYGAGLSFNDDDIKALVGAAALTSF